MPAAITVTGISDSYPNPGTFLEINWAQGEASGNQGSRAVLLMGNMAPSGTTATAGVVYGPDTAVEATTDSQVAALFGRRSELYRGWKRFVKKNKTIPVYLIAVADAGGTAASLTITAANAATGAGVARIWVGDEFVDVSIASGDSANTIAAAINTAVNAKLDWPVTSGVSGAVVTLTAVNTGPRGNYIRVMTQITSGIATTLTRSTDTPLSSGATDDSNTTALSTILSKQFFYIVSAADDATQVGALVTQVTTQALPATGMMQNVVYGSVDSLANSITVATGINNPLAEMVWSYKSPLTPFELACNHVAMITLFETSPNPRTNFINMGATPDDEGLWDIMAPRDQTAWPTESNITSALNNGISPIKVFTNGKTALVDRITNKSLTSSVADYRIRDKHKVIICQLFSLDLKAKMQLQHSGKRIANDPPEGAREPGANVITPKRAKATVFQVINSYDGNDLLDDAQKVKDETVVQRESSPTTRLGIRVPLRPIDNHRQSVIAVDQVF